MSILNFVVKNYIFKNNLSLYLFLDPDLFCTFQATDPDNDVLAYQIISGNNNQDFTIGRNTYAY